MTKKEFAKLLTQLTALAASYSADFHAATVNTLKPLCEKYGVEFNPAPAKAATQTNTPAAPLPIQVFGKPVTPPPDVDKPANPDGADN